MKSNFVSNHFSSELGVPAGGTTFGQGFAIGWQNGPLASVGSSDRKVPNGAFVEDVIAAAIDRLAYYQRSRFACKANADAIEYLHSALFCLEERTAARQARGVEGTSEV